MSAWRVWESEICESDLLIVLLEVLNLARSFLYFLLVRGNSLKSKLAFQQFSWTNISIYGGLSEHNYKYSNMRKFKAWPGYLFMYKWKESLYLIFLYTFAFLLLMQILNIFINSHIGSRPKRFHWSGLRREGVL